MASVTLTSAGTAATAGVGGSPYAITPSAAVGTGLDNYNISYHDASVGLTVHAIALDITATDQSKNYGDTFTFTGNEFTVGIGQLKNTDSVASVTLTSAGTAATAGVAGSPYMITPSAATGTGLGNYNISYHDAGVGLIVHAIALDITANNQSKNYADTFTFTGSEFTVGAGQLKNTDSVASVTLISAGAAGTATVAGSPYAIVASNAMGSGLNNYNIGYHDGQLTVHAIALDITANNQSKNYGNTFTFTGSEFTVGAGQLKNSDSVTSVTLTSAGAPMTATVAGSPYAITPSAAMGSGVGNYTIAYHDGSLTVNAIALDITANNRTKTYGDTVTFAGTEFTTGTGQLKNSDTVTSVTLISAGAPMTATVAGSPYAITPSAAMGSGLGNYMISYHNASIGLTVNLRGLDITANNRTKTYGATVTFAGTEFTTGAGQLVNGDTVMSVTLTSAGAAGTATVTAPGPNYPILPSAAVGTGLANYAVNYVNGTLHINPATVTITAANQSKIFGVTYVPDTTPPSVDFTITGTFYNGDAVTSITLTCAGYAASATVTPPGPTYPIVPSNAVGTGLGNYTVGYVNGTFTINAWTITGFYQPVDMPPVVNTVKGGSTVPLKFNIYAGNVERTSVSDVQGGTCQLFQTNCSGGPEDPIGDLPNTGGTALRYDTTGHQFIQNWQTPKGANQCYVVRMTAIDGSYIEAYFKTK